jgi:hypothetical protein
MQQFTQAYQRMNLGQGASRLTQVSWLGQSVLGTVKFAQVSWLGHSVLGTVNFTQVSWLWQLRGGRTNASFMR